VQRRLAASHSTSVIGHNERQREREAERERVGEGDREWEGEGGGGGGGERERVQIKLTFAGVHKTKLPICPRAAAYDPSPDVA
jgi:hypothetical protein